MPQNNPLKQIVVKQKEGKPVGIYSCCSANAYVIEAALEKARDDHSCVLIEATANQVDHHGGYTGMTPKDFMKFVEDIANRVGHESVKVTYRYAHLFPNKNLMIAKKLNISRNGEKDEQKEPGSKWET